MDKDLIKQLCLNELERRLSAMNSALEEVRNALLTETKSSAGDKHETSRAHAQNEVERLGNQLKQLEESRDRLNRIAVSATNRIQLGSFVQTTLGSFYLAEAIGKLDFEGHHFFSISVQSPLGKVLFGKKLGDDFYVNPTSSGKITAVF